MKIRLYTSSDKQFWDDYVMGHPQSTHCHLSGWKGVIENTYGHQTYYLIAEYSSSNPNNSIDPSYPINPSHSIDSKNSIKPYALCPIQDSGRIVGILPLVHIKSLIFGNQLVSMPFLNYGGVLADGEEAGKLLLSEAIRLGQRLKVNKIELRHINPLAWPDCNNSKILTNNLAYQTYAGKVRMLLELPGCGEELFKSFKPKLRSQIRRPQKEGMKAVIGGQELLDSFYDVFSINMRDLGSPVHSKQFFKQICQQFGQMARIGIINYKGMSVAAGIICCIKDTIEIPWASSLKNYNQFSPNMLLYWSFLEYSCQNGNKYFDFGRSTPEGGTYKFKEQWGAKPTSLHWQFILLNGQRIDTHDSEKSKFEKFIHYWQKLPVSFTKIAGPRIRKHIGL